MSFFRRRRSWVRAAPVGLGGLAVLAGLVFFVRGTWADDTARNPSRCEDAPRTQLLRQPDGSIEARCAVLLPHPMDEVWLAITDYEHFGDICTCVQATRIGYDPAGPTRIEAVTPIGFGRRIPFAVTVRYEQNLYEYVAAWDEPSGEVLVDRGRWVLQAVSPQETLLSLSLEVRVRNVPDFILRNISLSRVEKVVYNTQRRLRDGPSGKTW
jgi:hypothetical protein